jgi:tetratricopeptide (TPR) repeat protein
MKPKLFIGSSVEGLPIAHASQKNLRRNAEVTVWDQGIFTLTATALESLMETLARSDFGLFIFSPDDLAIVRGVSNTIVRDNVLFELGLFVGHLGKSRCFFMTPEDDGDLRLPSDLLGIQPATYEVDRSDRNWQAATAAACHEIQDEIIRHGPYSHSNIKSESELGGEGKSSVEPPVSAETISGTVEESGTTGLAPDEVTKDVSEKGQRKETKDQAPKTLISTKWFTLFADNQYEEALVAFNKAIKEGSDNQRPVQQKTLIALLKFYAGNDDWECEFKKAISDFPDEVQPYIDLARVYATQANTPKLALNLLDQAIGKFGPIEKAVLLKSEILEQMAQTPEAISLLEHAISQNSKNSALPIALAKLYVKQGKEENSLAIYSKAIGSLPTNKELLRGFAALLADQNKPEAAMHIYQRLLFIENKDPTILTLAGNVSMSLELYDRALRQYEKADRLAEQKEGWILGNIGNLYNARGFYTKASECLKQALQLEPDSDYAHERLAQALKAAKNQEERFEALLKIGSKFVADISRKEPS